jgi:hypothetical protein
LRHQPAILYRRKAVAGMAEGLNAFCGLWSTVCSEGEMHGIMRLGIGYKEQR